MSGDNHNQADQPEPKPCVSKTGWISGETYCLIHGRAAGWPCREEVSS